MFLVTGSNGQLGQSLKKMLTAEQAIFCTHENLDISIPVDHLKFKNLTAVINCAAYTNVEKAEDEIDLAYKINGESLNHLTDFSNKLDIPLIHISTDYVFDGAKEVPYLPNDNTHPLSIYGKSKKEGEIIFLNNIKKGILLRTSWVYSEFGSNFVKTMIRLGKEKSEVSVINDQWGSPTYATDLAQCILELLKFEISGQEIHHFTNSGSITWFDFAKQIMQEAKLDCQVMPIASSEYKTKVMRPAYAVLSKESIELKYKIKLKNWKDSLKQCLEILG